MYKIIKFIYFVLMRYMCSAEWIELTRIIDDSHTNSFTKSNFMQEIQPKVNLNPIIIKNSFVFDEFLNSNLSNEKSKVKPNNNNKLPDTTTTTTIYAPSITTLETVKSTEVDCNNCTYSTESTGALFPNATLSKISDEFNFTKSTNNLENVIDFMNQIQNSFNATTWPGKINILHTLKTDLITNIETRLANLFPDKIVSASKRRKRGIITSEGHMDFPSAEGALITICFLTFAVFLIKLVLQVINTIKSKHYNYNGLDQATMTAVKMMKSQKMGKSMSGKNYDAEKILSSIYNYRTLK